MVTAYLVFTPQSWLLLNRIRAGLTDRMPRGTYLLSRDGDDGPAVVCLSYTWTDDSMKWLSLSVAERVEVAMASLREIHPKVDLRKHMIARR